LIKLSLIGQKRLQEISSGFVPLAGNATARCGGPTAKRVLETNPTTKPDLKTTKAGSDPAFVSTQPTSSWLSPSSLFSSPSRFSYKVVCGIACVRLALRTTIA
jgi:hypothetical protein